MRQFDITFFFGPGKDLILREDVIADMEDAGITLAQLCHSTEINKKALPLLARHGIRADVGDPRISALYKCRDFEHTDETVRQVVADYAGFDNVEGFDICDEPESDSFPILSAIVSAFRKYAPDKETVINLFPNYATPEALHDTDYHSHLTHFVEQVDPHFLSYDHYHFRGRKVPAVNADPGSERARLIRECAVKSRDRAGFFENIEQIRRLGLEKDLDQMLIVLLVAHGPYRDLTRAEILWEVNMCLAYGFRRLSYFTYGLPVVADNDYWMFDNAMCDTEGRKMPHYFDVQAINRAVTPIGQHIFRTKSAAVFHTDSKEPGTVPFTGYGPLRSVTGDSGVIGFFEDGTAYLVNRDYQNPSAFSLHADTPISRFENGSFVPGGCDLTVTLPAGGGILLKF